MHFHEMDGSITNPLAVAGEGKPRPYLIGGDFLLLTMLLTFS